MTRIQFPIVITVLREGRAQTHLAPGARLPRKSESKLSMNSMNAHVVRFLRSPHLASKRSIASISRSNDVNQRRQHLTAVTKNPTCPPRPQFPPRNDSP
jgi:hypothetical protein